MPSAAETRSQENARKKATDYLALSAFSRKGLIKQLVFEGFTQEEATYGADSLTVDWNEQATKKPRNTSPTRPSRNEALLNNLCSRALQKRRQSTG